MAKKAKSSGGASDYKIGPLSATDLDPVIAIDKSHSGASRNGFFERRLTAAQKDPTEFVYVGARHGDVLVGFALARLVEGEFGGEAPVASLDSFGVDPDHQHHGVGQLLLNEIDSVLTHKGVVELTTELRWSDQALIQFLSQSGFSMAPRVVLSRDTDSGE